MNYGDYDVQEMAVMAARSKSFEEKLANLQRRVREEERRPWLLAAPFFLKVLALVILGVSLHLSRLS